MMVKRMKSGLIGIADKRLNALSLAQNRLKWVDLDIDPRQTFLWRYVSFKIQEYWSDYGRSKQAKSKMMTVVLKAKDLGGITFSMPIQ